MKVIQAIISKPQWSQKINNECVVAKWQEESMDQLDVRKEVFEYAVKEMQLLAGQVDSETGVQPSGVDLVWVRIFN
jgi:hypothetical protein